MTEQPLDFEIKNRFWESEREAINFFARHDGVELEFIVTREALLSVSDRTPPLSEEAALLTFDNHQALFANAAERVWRRADDSQPVYFVRDEDLER